MARMQTTLPRGNVPSDFDSGGFGLPRTDSIAWGNHARALRNPGAPPKQETVFENKVFHQFKEGGFKDEFVGLYLRQRLSLSSRGMLTGYSITIPS